MKVDIMLENLCHPYILSTTILGDIYFVHN